MAVKIGKMKRRLTQSGIPILLVRGRGDQASDHVVGTCIPPNAGPSNPALTGQLIFYQPVHPYRWLLLFREVGPGGYALLVAGMKGLAITSTAFGTVDPALQAATGAYAGGAHKANPHQFFTVEPSPDGFDVTADDDDFVADGDTTTDIQSATMNGPQGPNQAVVPTLQTFSDLDLQYWCAQFDSFSQAGDYIITVTDNVPNQKNRTVHVHP
jgi:hypothetical protein